MLKSAYAELYQKIPIEKDSSGLPSSIVDQNYVTFTAMQGKTYFTSLDSLGKELRFMLIGRAVNGWNEYRGTGAFDENLFVDASIKNLTNHPCTLTHGSDRFEWIQTRQNTAKNIYRAGIDEDSNAVGNYYLTRSPFWAYTKDIWDALYGRTSVWSDRWFENIVWSNLYKIAPHHGGNPSSKLMKLQVDACAKLLQAEIEHFSPTHILFVTGTDWFLPFKDIFVNQRFRTPNFASGRHKNENYVEGTAEYHLKNGNICKTVIACRPETRDKTKYTQQVSVFFKGLSYIEDNEIIAI